MQLFYEPEFLQTQCLGEMESKHCVRVLRKKKDDTIHIIDGKGNLIRATITSDNPKKCELQIEEVQADFEKRDYYIHLAIAPTKNMDRIEWCVEKAVELGVDEISFLKSANSERSVLKMERIERIVVSAMKQSMKAFMPKLNELQTLNQFVKACTQSVKLIAHLEDGDKKFISDYAKPNGDYCIMIGPEGDFSPPEIENALNQKFKPVSLGMSRLRTETAGVAVVNELNILHRTK